MEVRSERRHLFTVPPEELWSAMAMVDSYRGWWPWLRAFDGRALASGEVWSATVQPPLPYRLHFEVHLVEVNAPCLARARVTGDLDGEATLEVVAAAGGSELRASSSLSPTSGVLRAVANVAPAIARFGHEWVLETGLRQFQARALGR